MASIGNEHPWKHGAAAKKNVHGDKIRMFAVLRAKHEIYS